MLFNSYVFLLLFLPISAAVFFLIGRRSHFLAAGWLAGASLFFYGWWDYRYLPLLLASVTFNYWCAMHLQPGRHARRKLLVAAAIGANLGLLIYYKYAGFFASSLSGLTGSPEILLHIVLPIGISFFTFTQIAFLVDTYQGKVAESRFVHYLLFVTYFPHLIAGPVLHHKEMMPQFADRRIYRFCTRSAAVGATIFCIGLAKKVLIADNIAPYASPLFNQSGEPSLLIAWSGVLAYTFQLYFDFAGYSDMAIGLSRMFGVRLPLNFDSPYKSRNIAEFWRKWHMTLSRFLRDYLYIPLGGNRRGPVRRYANLMTTMVLGGLWHGAGWNFVVWGFLHGVYLTIQQIWSAAAKAMGFPLHSKGWKIVATMITFIAVCIAWVFFRAPDMATALTILRGMHGGYGIALPESIWRHAQVLQPMFERAGVTSYLGGGAVFIEAWSWIAFAAAITFLFPNTQEITRRYEPALDFAPAPAGGIKPIARLLAWAPTRGWAIAIGTLALVSMLTLNRPTDFLYFQF
jgi:alginate O-acetyltransferase complex protein AlgI